MAMSLRRKLTKRQARDNLKDYSGSDSEDSSSVGRVTPNVPPEPPKKDVMKFTPTPPLNTPVIPPGLHPLQTRQSSTARRGTSKFMFDRHRRIPVLTRSTIDTEVTSNEEEDLEEAADMASSEDVKEENVSPTSMFPSPPEPAPIIRLLPTIKVDGQKFVLLNDGPEPKEVRHTSTHTLPRITRSIGLQPSARRATRSLSRNSSTSSTEEPATRQKRADSQQDELSTDSKDYDITSKKDTRTLEVESRDPPRTPSPRDKIIEPLPGLKTWKGSSALRQKALAQQTRAANNLTPDPLTEDPTFSRSTSPLQKYTDDKSIDAVPVNPPIYNANLPAGQQWITTSMSTSRSDHEWGYSKRWTCCCCAAFTIVEQRVCAKLTCGHEMCGMSCRVFPRDLAQHTIL